MPPLRPVRALAATAIGAVLLVGCTTAPPTPEAAITSDDTTPAPTPPSPAAPDAPDAPERARCIDAEQRALVTAVDGQLDAIVEQDWDDALRFASPGFRDGIDAEAFAAIITDEFPVVAAAEARDIGACLVSAAGDEATLVVTVQDTDGSSQVLLYLFERGVDGWGISGALPGDGAGESDATQLTA